MGLEHGREGKRLGLACQMEGTLPNPAKPRVLEVIPQLQYSDSILLPLLANCFRTILMGSNELDSRCLEQNSAYVYTTQ